MLFSKGCEDSMADGYLNFDTKINEAGFNKGISKLSILLKPVLVLQLVILQHLFCKKSDSLVPSWLPVLMNRLQRGRRSRLTCR